MQQLIKDLTKLASLWLDPHYELRQQALRLAAEEFCLSPASFAFALNWIFSQWTPTNLAHIFSQKRFSDIGYAAQILAGNTPAMIAQGFLQAAYLAVPQAIKLPSSQAYFGQLLHGSFKEIMPAIASLWEVATWQHYLADFYVKLGRADLVVAYGSDETLEQLGKYVAPQATYQAHGHTESIAIIFKEAATKDSLEKLALDMLSYDQRGCLSPRVTLIESGGSLQPAECAQVFAQEILPTVANHLPRGSLFAGEAVAILHHQSIRAFHGPVYRGVDWTVSYAEQLQWPPMALPRMMPFHRFDHLTELLRFLTAVTVPIISVGCAGPAEKMAALAQALPARYCALEEMQKQLLFF